MSAGELRERVAFDKRSIVNDEYGNQQAGFVEQFQRAARIMPLKGGESFQAARLTGQQPVIITVRFDALTRTIQPDWQARDVRTGTTYAVRSLGNFDEHKRYIDVLAVSGVAA